MKRKKLEVEIEKDFVDQIQKWKGIIALKYKEPKRRGGPDRVVLSPYVPAFFVEFKRPGEKLRREQIKFHSDLKEMGYEVQVHDDATEAVEAYVRYCELFGVFLRVTIEATFEV